ncbi:MAG: hypothetical protein VX822_00460 [Candidatus Neomarinimicrobiota bacterium]|nr:hypothetical protein [Candidatus Neomarinimicrobiota bacterium]
MRTLAAIFTLTVLLLPQDGSPPDWTQYGRAGTGQLNDWGGLGFYRLKRIKGNTYYDLRLLGLFIPDNTLATARYKSSNKYEAFPRLYRFTVTSLRKSSASALNIRYHYNQGFGAFLLDQPTTNLTSEIALSYDMSDYLNDTRKTSYLKGGLFWDFDIARASFALDFEYFHQISDILPDETSLSRTEISSEMNFWIREPWLLTIGYEQEFYKAAERKNVRSIYLAIGFKRPMDWKL